MGSPGFFARVSCGASFAFVIAGCGGADAIGARDPEASTSPSAPAMHAPIALDPRPTMTIEPRPSASTPTDPGEATDVVASLHPQFQACIDHELQTEPSAGGYAVFELLLGADGHVASIRPKENHGLSSTMITCVEDVFARTRFRPPQGGVETHIEIPIQFRQRSLVDE